MKFIRLMLLLVSILMLAIAPPPKAEAQITTQKFSTLMSTGNPLVTVQVKVDSVNSYTTNAFTFRGYDAESFYTYPVSYAKLLTSAGTPKVTVYLEGSFGFDTWATVDTIMTTDSVKTFLSGTLDLNNKHFPNYRLKVSGTAGNRRDTQLDLVLYAYKKSY